MNHKWLYTCSVLLFVLFAPQPVASQFGQGSLSESYSFKASIIVDGNELEWEYLNPDEYEWEEGQTVIKGKKAKKEVEQLFQTLAIHKDAKANEMVHTLQTEGYANIEKLDVRWSNKENELFTWVWEK